MSLRPLAGSEILARLRAYARGAGLVLDAAVVQVPLWLADAVASAVNARLRAFDSRITTLEAAPPGGVTSVVSGGAGLVVAPEVGAVVVSVDGANIADLDAGHITTGTLPFARGGTGTDLSALPDGAVPVKSGTGLVDLGTIIDGDGNMTVNGIVTGTSFSGSGSSLSGVAKTGSANTFSTGPQTIQRAFGNGPSWVPTEGVVLENTKPSTSITDGSDAPAAVWKARIFADGVDRPMAWAAHVYAQGGNGTIPFSRWVFSASRNGAAYDPFITFQQSYSPGNDAVDLYKNIRVYYQLEAIGGIYIRDSGNISRQIFKRYDVPAPTNNLQILSLGTGSHVVFTDQAGALAALRAKNALLPVQVAGTTQAMELGCAYTPLNAALTTFTLPTTAAVGDQIAVWGYGEGGWTLAQNASQTVHVGNRSTTVGTGGSVTSAHRMASITMECVVANTTFRVIGGYENVDVR